LQLVLRDVLPASAGEGPLLRFSGYTSGYFFTSTNAVNIQTFNSNFIRLGSIQDSTQTQSAHIIDIYDYTNTATWKLVNILAIQNRSGSPSNFDIGRQIGTWNADSANTAVTSLTLLTDTSGGFTSGSYILYGVK